MASFRQFGQFLRNKASDNHGTVLSVSVSNGQFKALSLIDHNVHIGWEKPEPIESSEMLRQALIEAIQQTEFPGTHLAILVDHEQFLTRTLQLPAMPSSDLLPLLDRKAQQEKTWEGPTAWRYRLGLESRGKRNIHLGIWPQSYIDDLVQVCQELDLQIQQLAPISALSESQLSSIPVEPGEATLLITILNNQISFVVGNEVNELLFTRQLLPALEGIPLGERVATEANRTLLFVNQQVHLEIQNIWFLGEEDGLTIEDIQPHMAMPLLPCPVAPDWKYWLWVGATLPINLDNNFTPPHVLRAPLRNLLTKSVATSIAALLILAVGTTGIIEGYIAKNQGSVQAMTHHAQTLQQDQQRWQGQLTALQSKRHWIQTVSQTNTPSLEGPFLSYLGTILPQQTILQKASITRTDLQWEVELTGSITTNLSESLSLLGHLTNQLADGPYHMTVQQDWRDQLLTQTATPSTQKKSESRYRFTLKGYIT